jgi:soluble lytic murein transglycosylase-like protein
MRGVNQRNASLGGPEYGIRSAFAFVAAAMLAASSPALATGPGEGAANQYKLVLPDSQDYRLREAGTRAKLPAAEYTLGAPWAKPKPLAHSNVPNLRLLGKPFHEQILAAAKTHGVDSALVHAVIAAESNYQKNAVSPKGAIGLMQIMPETGARYGVQRSRLTKPDDNIGTGTRYLAELLEMFEGNLELALAGYNAGENAVLRYGMRIPPFAETRAYVARVKRLYAELRTR